MEWNKEMEELNINYSDEIETTYTSDKMETEKTEMTEDWVTEEKKKQEAEEKFNRLIENLENYPTALSILSGKKREFINLTMAKENEKKLEPEKTKICMISMIKHWTKWDDEKYSTTYVDRPSLISRLDSPYKVIPHDTIEDFIYRTDYPEKFGVRSRIDLLRLRKFVGEKKWTKKIEQGTHEKIEDWRKYMKSLGNTSKKLETLLEYGKVLADEEIASNREKLTGTTLKKNKENQKIEPSKDTQESLWFINLLEIIIFKIKMTYSQLMNRVKASSESSEREGRTIRTSVNLDGSSESEVSAKSMIDKKEIQTRIFISNTFHAIEYKDKIIIGDNTLLRFILSTEENELNMNIVSDYNSMIGKYEENRFIRFMKKIKDMKQPARTSFAAAYETVCLMMADTKAKSSTLPIIDAVIEIMEIDKKLGEELLKICHESSGEACILASTLAKMNTYAEVNEISGLEKYIQRTNRNHEVSVESTERLRCMMRMKIITNYIKKFGIVPQINCTSGLLEQELNLMASGGSYNNHIVRNTSYYKDVRLGKMLQPGNEVNISSRVIDKACTKDDYDFSGNSVKELVYYITQNDLVDLINEIKIGKNYETTKQMERQTICCDRKDSRLKEMKKFKICRLVEKEKELKTEGRFYGVASFKLKIYISIIMEMIKRAMKLIPGQMMTMTEDERRTTMHRMSVMLEEKDAYTLFLDYSGHNTSQRPENNLFILEEIADMYGFEENTEERKRLTQIVYLFNELDILYEHLFSDTVVWSRYQKGAIEGWFGPLWGIQSQLMLDDMMVTMGIEKYIGTTYSDDSCGVFIKKDVDNEELNRMIYHIQQYSLRMGLLVKLSQTQITNGRCSMLKNHYYFDKQIDTCYKRIMSISPNSDILWGDESERVSVIDSAYTSSVLRSDNNYIQTIIRNFRFLMEVEKDLIRWTTFYDMELDPRFLNIQGSLRTLGKMYLRRIDQSSEISELKEIENGMPMEDEITTSFYQFHKESREFAKITLAYMYLPSTCYGHSMTSMIDSFISGYSYSNIKRIAYVDSLLPENKQKIFIYSLIRLSESATAYISEPFPMTGGRYDTKTILKDELKKILKYKVENRDLKEILSVVNEEKEMLFKSVIVFTFEKCFSHRIASKFYECSIYNYVNELYAKINNSTTMSYLVGKKRMNQLWNKAWNVNHKIDYKSQSNILEIIKKDPSYFGLVMGRNEVEKTIMQGKTQTQFYIKFLNIEELPIIGKLSVDKLTGPLRCILKPSRVYSKMKGLRNPGPVRTSVNVAKFDRDLEIEGMFQNKLIFMAYELIRYVKWIIFDMEKYKKEDNEECIKTLTRLTDMTLSTYSDAKMTDIEDAVVCPKGGRYFHRALSGGFNPKTGDLSSNLLSSRVEVTGLDRFTDQNNGVDNNINLQLIITTLKVTLSIIEFDNENIIPLNLDSDVRYFARDVSFSLNGIKNETELNCDIGIRHRFENMSLSKLEEKKKLYHNFSNFISVDEDISGKFIDHKAILPNDKIEEIGSFQVLNKYMKDMEILIPTQIPKETLEKLVPNLSSYGTVDRYLEEFYKFYKGLNIIGNESFTKAVVRSMINQELFERGTRTGKDWMEEIEKYGFSYGYRKSLLKIFIVSCCMVFKVEEPTGNQLKITIYEDKTKLNCLNNIKRIKNSEAHLHINDKRISELINMAFPLVGYRLQDVYEATKEIMQEHNGRIIDGTKIIQYYGNETSNYLKNTSEQNCGSIQYQEIELMPSDLSDERQFVASVKAFEMISTLNCKPQHVSSPTKSDVYPSAKGLLTFLKQTKFITTNGSVADLFGGRGDFHIAMDNLNIRHTSISRNDGYNLINRAPGMREIKAGVDITDESNFGPYLDHDVFLLDISHFTGDPNNIIKLLNVALGVGTKVVMRLNSIAPIITKPLYNFTLKRGYKIGVLTPVIESPGYIYLTWNGEKYSTEQIRKGNESRKEKKTYNESLLTSNMVMELNRLRKTSILNCTGIKVSDHTEELISDDKLIDIMTSKDEVEYMPEYIESRLEKGEKIEELQMVVLEQDCALIDDKILDIDKIELIEDKRGARNLAYLKRKISETKTDGIKRIKCDKSFLYWFKNRYKIDNTQKCEFNILRGIKSEFPKKSLETIDKILSLEYIERQSKETWICIKKAIEQHLKSEGERVKCDIECIKLMIKGSAEYKSKFFSYDRIVKLSHIAANAIKTNTMAESILILSGLKSGVLSSLKNNKGKALRYDCLNIKLIMNRMMVLAEEQGVEVSAKSVRLHEIVKDVLSFRKLLEGEKKIRKINKKGKRERSKGKGNIESWFDDDEMSESENLESITENEIEEELKKLREFSTLEEYLESQGVNELFSAIADELNREGVRTDMTGEYLTLSIEEETKTMGVSFGKMLGVSEEEVEKNRNMTLEEMKQMVQEDFDEEADYYSDE